MSDYHRIRLDPKRLNILRNRGMNGSVMAQKPFLFKPTSFTSNIEGLKPKAFNQSRQIEWFDEFLEEPFRPMNYCLVSAPNDGLAKMLAAFMMQHALAHNSSKVALPLWVDLLGGFENRIVEQKVNASLLVLNNVGTNSTQPKLEKLRDIIETYSQVPKIVIAHGCDPYQFFCRHLGSPIHALAYLTTNSVKKAVDL